MAFEPFAMYQPASSDYGAGFLFHLLLISHVLPWGIIIHCIMEKCKATDGKWISWQIRLSARHPLTAQLTAASPDIYTPLHP